MVLFGLYSRNDIVIRNMLNQFEQNIITLFHYEHSTALISAFCVFFCNRHLVKFTIFKLQENPIKLLIWKNHLELFSFESSDSNFQKNNRSPRKQNRANQLELE